MSTQLSRLPVRSSRQLSRATFGSHPQFSSSSFLRAEDDAGSSGEKPEDTQRPLDPSGRQRIMSGLIQNVYQKSSSPKIIRPVSAGPPPKAARAATDATGQVEIQRTPRPVKGPGPPRGQPSGAVDARSFRANSPSDGSGGAKQLRNPTSLKEFQEKLRNRQRRGQGRGQWGTTASHARRAKPKAGRRKRNSVPKEEEEEADEDTKLYLLQKREAARQKPVRYNPEPYTLEKLKRTWPSLPIGESATAGTVMEKLYWMSERYVNSFEPAPELAQRIVDGKRVLFASEEEKDQVMELVQKMTIERADKLTERKGKKVEPEDMSFQALSENEKMDLFGSVVAGQYDARDVSKTEGAMRARIRRNLINNETYDSAQNTKFFDALSKLVPPNPPSQKGQAKAKLTR